MSIVSRILALVTSVGTDIKELYQKYTNLAVGRVVWLPVFSVTVPEDTDTIFVSYTPGMIRVSHTGILLRASDYTATNGSSIVFNFELKAGDEVDIERISVDNTASPVTVGGIIWHPADQINVASVTNTIPYVYNPGAIRVSHTGLLLRHGEDYTATSGTEIVFTNPLAIGDEIDIERITIDSTDQPTLNEILTALGDITELDTVDKTSVVAAINELAASGGGGGGVNHDIWTAVCARNDVPPTVTIGDQIPGAPLGTLFAADQLFVNLLTGDIYKLGSGSSWTMEAAFTANGLRSVNVLYGDNTLNYKTPGLRIFMRVASVTSMIVNSMNTTGVTHKRGTTYVDLAATLGDLDTLTTPVTTSVVAALNSVEKSTNKNIAGGYAGLDSAGTLSKAVTPEFTYTAFSNGLDNDPTLTNTGSIGNNSTARVNSCAFQAGFEIVVANSTLIRYKPAHLTSYSAADIIDTTATKTKVAILNNKIIVLDGDATTRLGYVADFTGLAPVFTTITHPSLTKRWYDVTYVGGYYIIVGEQGAVTVTADFVTYTDSVADPAGYGASLYDIHSIVYMPVTNRLAIAGMTPTSARSRTDGIFVGWTTPTNPLSLTWTNTTINNTFNVPHVGKKAELVPDPNGIIIVLNLKTEDYNTYGTRVLIGNTGGFNFPNDLTTTFQVSPGHPVTSGSWNVFYHTLFKHFIYWPARPVSGTTNPFSNIYYSPATTNTSVSLITRTKATQTSYGAMEGENGVIISYNGPAMIQRTLTYFANNILRKMPLINNKDWFTPVVGAQKMPNVSMRLGTINKGSAPFLVTTFSTSNTLNCTLSTAYGFQHRVTFSNTSPGGLVHGAYRNSGKLYFEVEFTSGSSSPDCYIGLGGPNVPLGTLVSELGLYTSNLNMLCLSQTGVRRDIATNTPAVTGEPSYSTPGDILCIAIDLSSRTLWYKVNNGLWLNNPTHDPAKGVGGTPTVNSWPLNGYVSPFIINNIASVFTFKIPKTSWTYAAPEDFEEWTTDQTTNSLSYNQDDVEINYPRVGQSLRFIGGLWKNKFDFEADPPNTYATTKDGNGIYTVVEIKTKGGRLTARSTLSGGTSPAYTTRTVNYYDVDGVTVIATQVFTLTYDGTSVISEVLN